MAKQTFTTGQVLSAAQVNALQANDYNTTVSTKTASYVLVAADVGTTIVQNVATANTVTVNTGLFAAGDTLRIQNIGAGIATVTAGTATVNTANSLLLPQWGSGILYFTSASAAIFFPSAGAAASSGMVLISRQSFSNVANTGTTFDNIFTTTYKTYLVSFEALAPATQSDFLQLQLRYAGSTTEAGAQYYGAALLIPPGNNLPVTNNGYSGGTQATISGNVNNSNRPLSGELFFHGVGNSSDRATFSGHLVSPTNPQHTLNMGMVDTARIYTGLIFKSSSSNITGTIAIYGLAAS
jgi:hypothetical protein